MRRKGFEVFQVNIVKIKERRQLSNVPSKMRARARTLGLVPWRN